MGQTTFHKAASRERQLLADKGLFVLVNIHVA